MQSIEELLEKVAGNPLSYEEREKRAIELAGHLLEVAIHKQTSREKQSQKLLARMMEDPDGKAFTMSMTDQCFRSQNTKRVANQLVFLLKQFGVPNYLPSSKRLSLYLFKLFGKILHPCLVPLAKRTLRQSAARVILPGEKQKLSHHMRTRREEGVRLNLNHLGEAILGEEEATRRLNVYLQDLESDDIEYISIKASTLFSQINILDWDQTIEILADRLRRLYRAAKNHLFKDASGKSLPKSVNIDMEEYRDLHISKELFKKVLNEEEFLSFSGGIALQAYLPDSFKIQQELTSWARQRVNERKGAPISIRIVKGANLAMEQVEASLQHWEQAPYKAKYEVDANYKRMLIYGCQPEHAAAVHIGVASHNLFDIAYAMLLRKEYSVEKQVSFEMLEGMANHICRTVQKITRSILLYCPVATREDFQSAIAYLIRRLDENTGPENFLRHSFGLRLGSANWHKQEELFSRACKEIKTVSMEPRRKQNRFDPPHHLLMDAIFQNESETDPALPSNHGWMHQVINEWREKTFETIPLVISGKEIYQESAQGIGIDPSNPGHPLYRYSLANWEQIDEAISTAKNRETSWSQNPVRERANLLSSIAQKMREKRGSLIGAMMKDGGKTYFESEPEVSEAIDFAEYYLRSMLQFEAMPEISFKSKGTILITPPWNFPISIPSGGMLAALITGNCVLFKPAPEAVLCGWILVNLFWEAGIPKEVLQFINCDDDPIGSRLIQDSRINTVILTGGTATARHFIKMRPSLTLAAETGGKNAIIITAMADRDLAIKNLVQSAFGHSGQKCSAASLAILEAEVYDDPNFMRQLQDAVESLPVGNCWNLSSKIVPLIRPATGDLLQGLTTLQLGEQWLVEPHLNSTNPHLWSPGVKLGITQGSFVHQTELFGPMLGLMRAQNLEEAIHFANTTPYGLTSGLQSLDEREVKIWMNRIETGNGYVNRGITGAIVQRQPFGGCKASSFGHGFKAGGPNYISQFMHKLERALPTDRHPVKQSVAALSPLAEKWGKLELWSASIESYSYWEKKFGKEEDPSKLVGEDNLLRYCPRRKMALRVEAQDDPMNALRALAAARTCEVSLFISSDPQFPLSLPQSKVEDVATFLTRLPQFESIRLLTPPSEELQKAAAEVGCFLDAEPVLSNGRLELLHYLREIVISIDYHRYGNLGVREGEIRSEIL